jgi:ABC-type transporter Mla MlaB component
VAGRVGPDARRRFEACFASVCNAAREQVTVDFSGVTGWEPGALDMVLRAVRDCGRAGSRVTFVAAPDELRQAMTD